jgi:hypothetical protein
MFKTLIEKRLFLQRRNGRYFVASSAASFSVSLSGKADLREKFNESCCVTRCAFVRVCVYAPNPPARGIVENVVICCWVDPSSSLMISESRRVICFIWSFRFVTVD